MTYPHGLLRVPRVLEHGLLVFGHELHELPPAVAEAPDHTADEEGHPRRLGDNSREFKIWHQKITPFLKVP